MNYKETYVKVKPYFIGFVLGVALIVAIFNTAININNSNDNVMNGIKKMNTLWYEQGIENIEINEINKFISDIYIVNMNYDIDSKNYDSKILVSGDGTLLFNSWIYLDELEDNFETTKSDNPDVYTFIQPFSQQDKLTTLQLIESQEQLDFNFEPGYYIKYYEATNVTDDVKQACYTTELKEGIHYGAVYCSKDGKEEVYESGFQRMIFEEYGYDTWKEYFKSWAMCSGDPEVCREDTLKELNFDMGIIEEIKSLNNIPAYMSTESQQVENFNVINTPTVIINGKEYIGTYYKTAICSAYNIRPEGCK